MPMPANIANVAKVRRGVRSSPLRIDTLESPLCAKAAPGRLDGRPRERPALHTELKRGQPVLYIQQSGGCDADYSDNDGLLGVVVRIGGSAVRSEEGCEHAYRTLGA